MNKRLLSFSWILRIGLLGVVTLALVLLVLTGVLPGKAALQANFPAAITNPQKAAILGAQQLLLIDQGFTYLYLPGLTR